MEKKLLEQEKTISTLKNRYESEQEKKKDDSDEFPRKYKSPKRIYKNQYDSSVVSPYKNKKDRTMSSVLSPPKKKVLKMNRLSDISSDDETDENLAKNKKSFFNILKRVTESTKSESDSSNSYSDSDSDSSNKKESSRSEFSSSSDGYPVPKKNKK